MELCVRRSKRSLVRPCEQTPCVTLHLSVIDSLPVLRCNARTLHVFRSPGVPIDVAAAPLIRQALSKALVPYYPLAGRLKQTHFQQLQLDCSSQGVLFVEASSTCTLSSLHYFDQYLSSVNIPFDQLLPDPDPDTDTDLALQPLVQMQVTQFACGGFVMGLIFCHSVCDGLGAAQFLNAVGELARGFEHLSVTPVWHRDFFPPHHPTDMSMPMPMPISIPMPNYTLQHSNFDIPIERINELKKEFHESTGGKMSCSTFEIVAATLWSLRTRAVYDSDTLKSKDDDKVKLVFFANCRQFVEPEPLAKGFYGNCFFPVTIDASRKEIVEARMNEVVKLIQEGKSRVGSEFREYYKKKKENGEDPFAPPLKYTTLFISEWGRLGFKEVDYGWGGAVDVIPIQGSAIIPVGIVGYLPLPRKGIRLMTWCVEETHRQSLLHHFSKLLLSK